MPDMLRDEDSTERHLDATRRHQRRCRKVKGAAQLADAIESARKTLADASLESTAALLAKEDAQDDLEFAGLEGADLVRTLSGRAKEYDREHPGAGVHLALFDAAGFGDVLRSDGTVDATTLDGLAQRIEKLGEGHPLQPLGVEATTRAAAIRAAMATLTTATTNAALALAREESAQAVLRRAYESNYLDGRKKFGREQVGRLFTQIRKHRAKRTGDGDGPGDATVGGGGPAEGGGTS